MAETSALGAFLRARREALHPVDVGLPATGYRRTPGLRREEVALLAGISADYYLRLEQGRERTPSVQVLDALVSALRLTADEAAHLHTIGRPLPRRPHRARAQKVPEGTLVLLATLPWPAFVEDSHLDILAANPFAEALSPNMRVGVNRLVAAFLDPRDRELHEDWERATAAAVAQLRQTMGARADDPRLISLVGELSVRSEWFRQLWSRQDVVRPTVARARLHHPDVGELDLYREKLVVAGTDGQTLVIYHAEPGSASAQSLALLGSMAATSGPGPAPASRPHS